MDAINIPALNKECCYAYHQRLLSDSWCHWICQSCSSPNLEPRDSNFPWSRDTLWPEKVAH